jgi:putative ABC transport system permease protein
VGIVGDIRYDGPENDPRPQAFVPFAQTSQSAATLIVRTRPGGQGGQGVLGGVRAAFAAAYPEGLTVPVSVDVQTLESYMSDLVAQRRFNMWLLGVFGVLGIAIACIGIYGVMAYLVAQRTHEIGIRMALGAVPSVILWSVLGRTSRYIGLGLIAGITGAWMLSTTVKGLLFGIEPHDVTVYVLVGGLLSTVGLLAAFVPARRAAKVDPLVALRVEG